jgi:hypothetical protein
MRAEIHAGEAESLPAVSRHQPQIAADEPDGGAEHEPA